MHLIHDARSQANGALGADPDGPQAKAEGFMLRLITWAAGKAVLAELDGLGNEGDLVVAPHAERMKDPEYAALVRAIEVRCVCVCVCVCAPCPECFPVCVCGGVVAPSTR